MAELLWMAQWTVFTDNHFWKCSWVHAVIFTTESYLFLMQDYLRAQRSQASNADLWLFPLWVLWIKYWFKRFSKNDILFLLTFYTVSSLFWKWGFILNYKTYKLWTINKMQQRFIWPYCMLDCISDCVSDYGLSSELPCEWYRGCNN